jgi:hypothetical protein
MIIKYIAKGLLFWVTIISFIAFIIGGAESLINANLYSIAFIWLTINGVLVYLCKHIISYRELYKITGYTLFN